MSEASATLHEPFENPVRQREAAIFGLWIFLASEILLFAGFFFGLAIYRHLHPAAFTEAAQHTNLLYGAINTLLLLTSSFAMSVAGRALEAERRSLAEAAIWATLALGIGFLCVKGLEYREDLTEHLWPGAGFDLKGGPTRIFFAFYWCMTFIHSCHLMIGLGFISRLGWMARRRLLVANSDSVEVTSLYWHLVDVVWVFVFTSLYLVGK